MATVKKSNTKKIVWAVIAVILVVAIVITISHFLFVEFITVTKTNEPIILPIFVEKAKQPKTVSDIFNSLFIVIDADGKRPLDMLIVVIAVKRIK